ncbi:NAD dependent epimerase [Grosmannia clavigera kw1407]|uniref:NAD dependent epimerase n=1 Tax=Grosmannia clavigera (strain kw1407 / UAMH 11150) TaxID=655863 RepID=F0X6S5_GROCL|nr:NAD dependent epimerase [Grosmannia clavigera kw1407]EFX06336.1 NAD dependent epimerase [Grosmannia clavigera kw1407]
MTKVLLTGGSGFIATHILDLLLKTGHAVVTTVRSPEKAAPIHAAYPDVGPERLQTVIVPDIAQEQAFDEAVQVPGIEVVLHTASPFHFRVTDLKRDLVDPAVIGTTGILRAIAAHAPQVRRVVVTSSFAAIADVSKSDDPTTIFTEASWNPVTLADVTGANNTVANAGTGYRASKTLAEQAAWAFVRSQKPNFDLVTINPPMVYGPVLHHVTGGIAAINTSSEIFRDVITGAWKDKDELPPVRVANFVDVRDVATAHVAAGFQKDLGGHRLFTTSGHYDNRTILEIVRAHFPEYADVLPPKDIPGGDLPAAHYGFDNSETTRLLGITWIPLEKSVVDAVKSIQPLLQ